MQRGVVFPQPELAGARTSELRRYAENIEGFGYRHLLVYDHVLGADPERNLGWTHKYTARTTFREPFVFFGFLAAATALELVTGVLVLPQRQTALVAKQAAEVDLLTGGRFRLGIGLGWNAVEYQALGKNFSDRGARMTEQVALLRQLWTREAVTFAGAHEQVTAAGLAPLPVQRPIPLWFGASSRRAYVRAGQLGDGWFPQVPPGPRLDEARSVVEQAAAAAGRDPAQLGMEGRVSWGEGGAGKLAEQAGRWREAGASHLSVSTMGAGLASVDDHLAALSAAAAALGIGPR
jgi:probable F420-dependent oxidoreductase